MLIKVVLFFCLIVASQALPLLVESNALPEVGASTQYKTEDNHGNYAFGYSEDHTSGGSFRKEYGDSMGNKIGSYGLHNSDGRARVVNYVADSAGFRADVHTNEPGVDPSQDSADVTVNKPVVVAAAATIVAHSPAVVAHSPAVVAHSPAVVAHTPAIISPAVVAHTPAIISPAVTHHVQHSVTLLHPTLYHGPFTFLTHGSHFIL